jgi:UDP-glucose 4-epimerase
MKKVLVTGASGFLGSHLCEGLLGRGYEVFALIYGSKRKIKHLEDNVFFHTREVNITNFKKIIEIFDEIKPEGVFHVAALHSPNPPDDPFPFFEANIKGTLNILEACRKNNIKKIIYSSSMSVYGLNRKYLPVDEKHPVDPYDFYSITKSMGEEWCKFYSKEHNQRIIILRYVGIFGPRRDWGAITNFVKSAIAGRPLRIFNNINWDIIYVEDVSKANNYAFEKLGDLNFEIINIGSGREFNIKEVALQIKKLTKSNSKIEFAKNLDDKAAPHFYFNITKAKKLLGFEPTPLVEGLKKYINYEKGL